MCVLYGRGVQADVNEASSMGAVPAAVVSGGDGGCGRGAVSSCSGASPARVCCAVCLVLTVLTASLSFRSCVCLVWSWCAGRRE